MFNNYRKKMCLTYNNARNRLLDDPKRLISVEKFITHLVYEQFSTNINEYIEDYNEASFLFPFWANYPPDARGRKPVGDQIPWIEVGEHSIGHKASRIISHYGNVREVGLPSGADNRFLFQSDSILQIMEGLTDSVMIFLDIKSVGPRDNFEHTVVSPFQISGDGIWNVSSDNLVNTPFTATGMRASHLFYPAISPIYVLSSGLVAPTVHIFVKPIYSMPCIENPNLSGQPLESIRIITVPNGLLLTLNPGYIKQYPHLFFPGKDDKSTQPFRVRSRVSFEILAEIDAWRVEEIRI